MIPPLEHTLSTDSKETGFVDGRTQVVTQSPNHHAKIHFAIRDLQIKVNEIISFVNELEIPDEP